MSTPILFDVPGPRAKRQAAALSMLALTGLIGLGYILVQRLSAQGQLDVPLWSPLFNPGDDIFGEVWQVLAVAGLRNLQAAALAMAFSLAIGAALALTRVGSVAPARRLVAVVVEILRGIPVVVTIFFAARVLPELGINLSTLWYLVIGLTAYNSVVIAEIIRAGLAAVPRGQFEAAQAIGFTPGRATRIILLPQAIRMMLPALVSQLIVTLKDTALGFIIGYEELLRTANRVGTELDNPLQSLLLAAAIFISCCYGLSKVAEVLERRTSRAS